MKKTILLCTILGLAGCGDEAAPGASGATTAAASQKPTATAAVTATATAAAPATAAPAAGAYRGLKAGDAAVGFIKDPKDEGQCGVVGEAPGAKDKLDDKKLQEVAKMLKGEVTTTCPTENIVGACTSFGIAVQYYGPKYTKDTAKKDCKGGTWTD